MLRILKFIGVFLGTLLLVFLIVFGFNLDALVTLYENSEDMQEGQEWVAKTQSLKGLTEYIAEQPEHVSVASLALANSDSSILYNEHSPRTMGALSNIFLVIEYARQVENGTLNSGEPIPLAEVDRYQLPYMDASNHTNALNRLKGQDKVSDENTVALSDLMQVMVEFNDLAAFDYLFLKFGPERIASLMDQLNLEETENLLPFSGLHIALKPSLYGMDYQQRMDSLSTMNRDAFDSLAISSAKKLSADETFHKKVTSQFEEDEGLGIKFIQQRNMLDLFPKTTAWEMANLMKKLQQGELISKGISDRVKEIMSWPINNSRLQNDFNEYGAIYDSRLGLVNGIDYGVSTYSDESFAQAVLFDQLQVALWFHMSSTLIHQDFEQRLIWDPALRKATIQEIEKAGRLGASLSPQKY